MRKTISIFCLFLVLTACGGVTITPTNTSPADTKDTTPATTKDNSPAAPSTSNDNTKVGVFIDAPVQGLAYTSLPSGKKGTTNEKGEFEYIDGDTVSFNMGSIELGSATPDKTNKVKVTQLEQALLVAQLLQVLDTDADENKIDISDIVIPEAVKKAIIDKLADKDGDASTSDVITSDQLVSIKQANPEKLTLQQRAGVIPKDKVLEHVKQQIGEPGLRFSASELANQLFFNASLLTEYMDSVFIFPSVTSNPTKWIVVDDGKATLSQQSWNVDDQGNLKLAFQMYIGNQGHTINITCTLSKIAEGDYSIDVSSSCPVYGSEEINRDLGTLLKPQPFSANDLSGKSFNFTSLNKENETLTFRNDGTYDSGDEEKFSYKDADHKNAVWIHGGDDDPQKGVLVILAQGTLAKGKLLLIHYKDDGNTLDSVEVIKVSGNTLKQLFVVDSLEGSSANGITSGNDQPTTDENEFSSAMPEGFTAPPKDAAVTDALVDYYNPSTGETWQSSTGGYELAPGWIIGTKEDYERNKEYYDNFLAEGGNVAYIPFTQDMISGKTFYTLATYFDPNNIPIYLTTTIQFDSLNGKNTARGRSQYKYDENLSDIDTTFSYAFLKDSLILSNFFQSGSEPENVIYKLLTQTDQFLKVCLSFKDIKIKDNNNCAIEFWYYDKTDAEAALENQ